MRKAAMIGTKVKSVRTGHTIQCPCTSESSGRVVRYIMGRQTRQARPAIKKGAEPPLICSFLFIIMV